MYEYFRVISLIGIPDDDDRRYWTSAVRDLGHIQTFLCSFCVNVQGWHRHLLSSASGTTKQRESLIIWS